MARSSHSSSSSSTPPPECYQRPQGHRSSARSSSSHYRPSRTTLNHDNGMRTPFEDVTDVVLATEYYWSSESWPQPRGQTTKPYNASRASTSTLEAGSAAKSGRRSSPAGESRKLGRRGDLKEGEYRLSAPPQTPHLDRLGTPDLELTR